MINKIQFTADGFEKIKEELIELKSSKQQKAIDRLQSARAMGDLSENSEYTAAKEDLSFVEGRIRELEEVIKNAEIVEADTSSTVVKIGCTVVVDINGRKDEFAIVGEFEANPMEKKLSQTSPIGKALLGKRKGQSVDIKIPDGRITYKIIDIKS